MLSKYGVTGTIARVDRGMTRGATYFHRPQRHCARSGGPEVHERMKKSLLVLLLLPAMAAACFAQESRQDISASGSALIPTFIAGNAVQLHATVGYGGLISYRYLLTPSSGLELNYQYAQQVQHYLNPTNNILIHNRFQEISGAYVYSFTFRNFNPFVEAGIGGYIYSPIDDQKTQLQNLSQSTNIGGLYGGGIAYEISPSFDIRIEYRGIIVKTPSFNQTDLKTNRYYNLNDPVIGVAYHF
jgi:opacity protein-like surface antigen